MIIIMVILNHNCHAHAHECASYTKASDIVAHSKKPPTQMI
jgi:hypothetical protein